MAFQWIYDIWLFIRTVFYRYTLARPKLSPSISVKKIYSVGSFRERLDTIVRTPAHRTYFSELLVNKDRCQIMYVDPDVTNRIIIQSLLWDDRYKFIFKDDAAEVVDYLKAATIFPELIIFDQHNVAPGFVEDVRNMVSYEELPIIVITDSKYGHQVVENLTYGVNDFIVKPLRRMELLRRVQTQVTLVQDMRIKEEADKTYALLKDILPTHIISDLIQRHDTHLIAETHPCITILFTDIVRFTNIASEWPIIKTISMLNDMFTRFDVLCERQGVYKVETIGDSYMVACGHFNRDENHAEVAIRTAFEMLNCVQEMGPCYDKDINIRIGIHTGPAYSGVIGKIRPRYCFFGDTINTASRMESTGFASRVQISSHTYSQVKHVRDFQFESCGFRDIKGKGLMETFIVDPTSQEKV